MKLYKKNGKDWLGEILFVETNGEREGFLEIMKIEGWEENQYMVYNENAKPSEYHNHSFNFNKCWKSLNGYMSYPMNLWYDHIDLLQEQDIIPDDDKLQLYTGYGANETTKAIYSPGQSLEWYFWWHYYIALSQITYKGNWVHPFWEHGFLSIMQKYGWQYLERAGKIGFSPLSVSKLILEEIEPELAKVKKMTTSDIATLGYRDVSDEIIQREIDNYNRSWHHKNKRIQMQVCKRITHCQWWGSWALASFCEHLIKTGHNLGVEC